MTDRRSQTARFGRRTFLLGATASAGAAALNAPAVLAQAKPFQGVTLNGASFQHGFMVAVRSLLPEFQERTGITVNLTLQSFPVYNQQMDLELSTKGSSYDFCNITFPFSGRWVGSDWFSPLDEFVSDANATPGDWEPKDFISGAQAPFVKDGKTYGFAWVTGVQMLAAARADLIEKAGLKMPTTFDELLQVCAATHSPQVAAYANDRLHHWQWPPFLMGFGGRVLRDPPKDIMPVLDSPESAKAGEYYATLLTKYGPPGVLSFTDDQVQRGQYAGRFNIRTQSLDWLLPIGKSSDSQVRDTVRYAPFPRGPAGAFPGVNSQGLGIPAGAKQKRAAWEFIKWVLSKEMVLKLALQHNQVSVARRSALANAELKAAMTVNGQDIGAMYLSAVEEAGRLGYMTYRTLPFYPQIGEKVSKAIERIATGQASAEVAMAAANKEAIDDLKKAGAL